MTPIASISSTTIVAAAGSTPRRENPAPRAPKASSSRALIALQPAATSSETPMRTRADARFLAHLIATDQKVPQTRERRRADPQDAVTAYAAANAEPAAPTGGQLFRVM
jgi:hypothetical protein